MDTNTGANNNNDTVDVNYNAAGDESFFKGGIYLLFGMVPG